MAISNTEKMLQRRKYGYVDIFKEISKINKLISTSPNLTFTKRDCPFNFNLALDRNLIEPSGRYISRQLKDGGITLQEWQFRIAIRI